MWWQDGDLPTLRRTKIAELCIPACSACCTQLPSVPGTRTCGCDRRRTSASAARLHGPGWYYSKAAGGHPEAESKADSQPCRDGEPDDRRPGEPAKLPCRRHSDTPRAWPPGASTVRVTAPALLARQGVGTGSMLRKVEGCGRHWSRDTYAAGILTIGTWREKPAAF